MLFVTIYQTHKIAKSCKITKNISPERDVRKYFFKYLRFFR